MANKKPFRTTAAQRKLLRLAWNTKSDIYCEPRAKRQRSVYVSFNPQITFLRDKFYELRDCGAVRCIDNSGDIQRWKLTPFGVLLAKEGVE